ncbi:hypothetical protein Lfu02_00890 [Longispora fulva]|uniref:Uncharacterized protein n=1 Tax=Longispora fulva TaxID=619741 RepID=A0A8J7KJY7_9ACTN|nr:hypothetical protein [Longispora fulva]MBG6136041.1 hypothetical protein [Longispora fulva]GIG55717.1 hypothetical protein Lfu02_00890 [Longispora fulva]
MFCHAYGSDVTASDGYAFLRDARELRKVTFAAQMAAEYPDRPRIQIELFTRLARLRGAGGDRPWKREGVP